MPTVQHLEDTSAVAARLWDEWWPARIRESTARELPGGGDDARTLYVWLAGIHDVGKLCPQFTDQLQYNSVFAAVLDDMVRGGLSSAPVVLRKAPHHSLTGQVLLERWLDDAHGLDPRSRMRLGAIIGAHHGVPPTAPQLERMRTMIGDLAPTRQWEQVQREVLDGMAERTGVAARLPDWRRLRLSGSTQLLLAGMVVVADWLASDASRFPLLLTGRPDLTERAAQAVGPSDFPAPWRARTDGMSATELLRSRFPGMTGALARPVQEAAVAAARNATDPALIIVEAGTGEGKTEAALLAAEVLAEKHGCGGVIFALPTQATSDGVFPRLTAWVSAQPQSGRTSVFLAHGKAALNADYRHLQAGACIRGVYDDIDQELDPTHTEAVVTSWLRGRRRGVLANFVVGTIDQVLFGALRARHLPLRQVALAGKVVIIDEVHAADEFMQVYLHRALQWLGAHGTPVVLLSATIPPRMRADLVASYRRGRLRDDVDEAPREDDAYPRVTLVMDAAEDCEVPSGGHVTREIEVARTGDEWVDIVAGAVEEGACVAAVCNTVSRAREAYEQMVERVGEKRAGLLHSQFLAVHRASKERDLRRLLGPPDHDGKTPDRPRGYVICATQVIEQSLDIDVDLMVTDLAPMDLILQRAGRLHRHLRGVDEEHRPTGCRRPRLLVRGIEFDGDGLPQLDRGAIAVYGERNLLRALVVLGLNGGARIVSTPADVAPLVRAAYADDVPHPPAWDQQWEHAEQAHRERITSQRRRAQAFAIDDPGELSDLAGLVEGRTGDPDTAAGAGQARVRDSDESVEVIVVRQTPEGLKPLPDTGIDDHVIPDELDAPEPDLARALATCTLRLPRHFSHPGVIDRTIRELEKQSARLTGWAQSPWLVGELALILNEDLTGLLLGARVSYDARGGLRWSREDQDD